MTNDVEHMELPDEVLAALLARWPVARLATVGGDGRPHVVPVVFCGEEGVIYSPLDGKRKRGTRLQRLQNLETNPQASVLLDEYCEDWQRLWWVRIDGDADWCEPAEPLAGTIADRLVEKYRQYRGTGITFDPTGYLRVRPTKVTAWSQTGSLAAIVAAIP